MANNNTRWPGQRNEAVAAEVEAVVENIPLENEGEKPAREKVREERAQFRETPTKFREENERVARRVREPFDFGWLDNFFRKGYRGRISPAVRARLLMFGLAVVLADGYLGYIFMTITFPDVKNVFVQIAPSLIFSGAQVAIFTKGHSFISLVMMMALFGVNIWCNVGALIYLFAVKTFALPSEQGLFILTVAAAVGCVGEIFIGLGTED